VRAAVLKRFGAPLAIEEVSDCRPGPDEAVVRVEACGIDGTDLKLLDGFGYAPDLPFVMGHEPAGVVEAVGERVTAFKPGDRVIPYIFMIPPESPWFHSEREQLAPDMTGVLGVKGHAGGLAERLCIAARQLVTIPDEIAMHDAAVHCDAGLTAYHAVRRSRISAGDTVLIIGVGGVGSFAVQYAALSGARVIAAERTPEKREWAQSLGAMETVASPGIAKAVHEITKGRGVDCVLDVVGTEVTMAESIDSVCPGGRIILIGYTPDSFTLSGKRLAQNELELIGTRAGSRAELTVALNFTATGRIRSIVTDREPLTNVNAALEKLRDGRVLGRLVLDIAA
jgi:propanol-preferring alcohol dehydrogenase